jgi:sterol desaturase/sphingolipid hydroxylase (fatty acid hydroxylase superfamily)
MQMVGCQLFLEASFYWIHRALHHPTLYKHIHKQHHEYKGTIGFATEYATPAEQVRDKLWMGFYFLLYFLHSVKKGCLQVECA